MIKQFKKEEKELLDKSEKNSKRVSVISVCLALVGIAIFVVATASLPFINSPGTVALYYLSGAVGIIPMVLMLFTIIRTNFKKYRKQRNEREFEALPGMTWSDDEVEERNERINIRNYDDNMYIKAQNKAGKILVTVCTGCCLAIPFGIIPVVFQFLAVGHTWHMLPMSVSSLFHGGACVIAYRFAYKKIFQKMVLEIKDIDKKYEQ